MYSNIPNCEGHNASDSADATQYRMNCYDIDSNGFSFYAFKGDFLWTAKGY